MGYALFALVYPPHCKKLNPKIVENEICLLDPGYRQANEGHEGLASDDGPRVHDHTLSCYRTDGICNLSLGRSSPFQETHPEDS